MKKNRYVLILLLTGLGLAPVFLGSRAIFTAFSQSADINEKRIDRANEPDEPLEIASLKADGTNVELGQTFRRHGDWLKDFTVTYRNKSDRTIVGGTIYLSFPETTDTGNIMMHGISFGQPRIQAAKDRSILVQPGETFTVIVNEKELTRLKAFLSRRQHSLDSLSKVELSAGFILFDDGTAWSAGSYRIQDPNRPGIWIDDPKRKGVKP